MTTTLNMDTNDQDALLIAKIVERAMSIGNALNAPVNRMRLTLDLTAVHANGTPLQLTALLEADQKEFMHDVWGVMNYIDRTTGKLTACFFPRFALENA